MNNISSVLPIDNAGMIKVSEICISNIVSWNALQAVYRNLNCTFRCCSNYIFILNLTPGFNGLCKDICKTTWETFKFWYLVWLILEVWWCTQFFCAVFGFSCTIFDSARFMRVTDLAPYACQHHSDTGREVIIIANEVRRVHRNGECLCVHPSVCLSVRGLQSLY